jgi:hypothetical protein
LEPVLIDGRKLPGNLLKLHKALCILIEQSRQPSSSTNEQDSLLHSCQPEGAGEGEAAAGCWAGRHWQLGWTELSSATRVSVLGVSAGNWRSRSGTSDNQTGKSWRDRNLVTAPQVVARHSQAHMHAAQRGRCTGRPPVVAAGCCSIKQSCHTSPQNPHTTSTSAAVCS